MKPCGWVRLASLVALLVPGGVAAQTAATGNTWNFGTTISVCGGVATASSSTGALAGAAAGWEITPRVGLDGKVAWLDRPDAAEDFTATLAVHANLLTPRTVVPFLKGGVGVYRASFASSQGEMPDFYRQRLREGLGRGQAFWDPAFVAGGGVNLFTGRHWALRPEVEAIVVRYRSRNHVVTAFTVHLAYHFEDHPVTPAQERK